MPALLRPLDWRGASTALLLAALWGGNPVAVKIGLLDVPPLRLAFFRFVLGGLAILAYAACIRHRGIFDVRPGEWRVLISLGVIFSVQIATMNVGIGLTGAAHGAVLLTSYAVHAVVLQNAGHRDAVWVALEPAALRWLGHNVAGFRPRGALTALPSSGHAREAGVQQRPSDQVVPRTVGMVTVRGHQ